MGLQPIFERLHCYRPQQLMKGNVFTPVCQSFCSRGGDVCPCGGRTPLLGIHRSLPKTATAAYGTHPTGMHTYFSMKTVSLASLQN